MSPEAAPGACRAFGFCPRPLLLFLNDDDGDDDTLSAFQAPFQPYSTPETVYWINNEGEDDALHELLAFPQHHNHEIDDEWSHCDAFVPDKLRWFDGWVVVGWLLTALLVLYTMMVKLLNMTVTWYKLGRFQQSTNPPKSTKTGKNNLRGVFWLLLCSSTILVVAGDPSLFGNYTIERIENGGDESGYTHRLLSNTFADRQTDCIIPDTHKYTVAKKDKYQNWGYAFTTQILSTTRRVSCPDGQAIQKWKIMAWVEDHWSGVCDKYGIQIQYKCVSVVTSGEKQWAVSQSTDGWTYPYNTLHGFGYVGGPEGWALKEMHGHESPGGARVQTYSYPVRTLGSRHPYQAKGSKWKFQK